MLGCPGATMVFDDELADAGSESGIEAFAEAEPRCGPHEALVVEALDGATLLLSSGQIVAYAEVEPFEAGDCWALEAWQQNRALAEGQVVRLAYASDCAASVWLHEDNLGLTMIELGAACSVSTHESLLDLDGPLPPHDVIERHARMFGVGMWGSCALEPCD